MIKFLFVLALVHAADTTPASAPAKDAPSSGPIETACAPEATTAKCTGKKGEALHECLHEYRRSNPAMKVSSACRSAIHKLRKSQESK